MLLTQEEMLLQSTVREFADQQLAPNAAHHDETGEFPADNIHRMAELGLFGLGIAEEYGGSGGTTRQLSIVAEELARGCVATSTIFLAHLSLATQFIHRFGTKEQKQSYVPDMARAEKIGAFALTESGAGSDAAGIQTTATRCGDCYMLNGTKLFTTNAMEADIFIVLATLDVGLRSKGIIALIVDGAADGLTVNPMHGKMGIRASSTAEVVFDDCAVTVSNRIGGEDKAFRTTMEILNASRIGIAAQAVGIAQAAYEATCDYIRQRRVFGQQLSDFQGIRWTVAEMATDVTAARLLTRQAATLLDEDQPFATEASMAKLFASRVAVETTDKAVQIHGGVGYFAPTVVERLYRDAKITEIYEGTSEIQRTIIARNVLEG